MQFLGFSFFPPVLVASPWLCLRRQHMHNRVERTSSSRPGSAPFLFCDSGAGRVKWRSNLPQRVVDQRREWLYKHSMLPVSIEVCVFVIYCVSTWQPYLYAFVSTPYPQHTLSAFLLLKNNNSPNGQILLSSFLHIRL